MIVTCLSPVIFSFVYIIYLLSLKRFFCTKVGLILHIKNLIASHSTKHVKTRHEKDKVEKKPLSEHKGDCFVGIDAGSTTSKLVVTDRDGVLLYSAYQGNGGKPLDSIIEMLKKLYFFLCAK